MCYLRSCSAGILAAVTLVALVSCGGTAETKVQTVTVETPTSTASAAPAQRHKAKARLSPQKAGPSFVRCDANIEAKAGTTTCGFAQNAFWQYWTDDQPSSIEVWSPATRSSFTATCTAPGSMVVCRTDDGGIVRFTQAAVDSYSSDQADAYASSHDLGPDPYEQPSADPPPASAPEPPVDAPADVPTSGGNIPSYEDGRGYRVQCSDGMYSQSGGIQGACSGHGGVAP